MYRGRSAPPRSRTTTQPGSGTVVNRRPVAVFTSGGERFGGVGGCLWSSDPDGTIESYAWDFGEGLTGRV